MDGIEWLNFFGNVGFPIAITVYLLIRLEKRMELLISSVQDMKHTFLEEKAKRYNDETGGN
jgi:YvrJ protein family